MNRRKFLIGMGSLAAGGAAAMGTGAFRTAQVNDREFRVDIADDSSAYVELNALNEKYAEETDDGQLRVAVGPLNERPPWDQHPDGINANSVFYFDEVFQIANPGGWGDMRFVIELDDFDEALDVDLTVGSVDSNDGIVGDSVLMGDYDSVDEIPKLHQPDSANIDMKISNTKEESAVDVGGTMTIYAATGGNRDQLAEDTDLSL